LIFSHHCLQPTNSNPLFSNTLAFRYEGLGSQYLKTHSTHNDHFRAKEGFQIESGWMSLSANEEATEKALDKHSGAWKNEFSRFFTTVTDWNPEMRRYKSGTI